MKLSRVLIFYIFLVVMVPNFLLVQGASTDLQVTFTTNPTIVPPGTNGLLEVNLKSLSGTVNNINIDVLSWDSSAIYAKGNWEVRVGDLPGGDTNSILYEFYVPSSATPGLYQIVFEISSSAGVFKQTAIIRVEDSTLLDLVSVTPSSISIGRASTVFFNVTNNGGTSSGNILFTWEDPSSLILPVGSDNRISVSSIAPGNYTEIPVSIMASPSITPGVYPLTVNIEFYDRTGTIQTVTSIVGLQIGGTTDFEIVLQQSMGGSTTFAVANTGAEVASSVIVSIPPQINYATTGASSVSLGNLDAGDYTLATFQISTSNVNASQRPSFYRNPEDMPDMPSGFDPSMVEAFRNQSFVGAGGNDLVVEISYTDLFGVRQSIEKLVTLSSTSSGSSADFASRFTDRTSIPGQSSGGSDNGIMYITIGIIGVVVIIVIIQIGRMKKLPKISKLVKGNKK